MDCIWSAVDHNQATLCPLFYQLKARHDRARRFFLVYVSITNVILLISPLTYTLWVLTRSASPCTHIPAGTQRWNNVFSVIPRWNVDFPTRSWIGVVSTPIQHNVKSTPIQHLAAEAMLNRRWFNVVCPLDCFRGVRRKTISLVNPLVWSYVALCNSTGQCQPLGHKTYKKSWKVPKKFRAEI